MSTSSVIFPAPLPQISIPHRSLCSPWFSSNPSCSVCDASCLLKILRLWNMAFFGSSWDPEFRWGSLETRWKGREGPQGAKVLQLIGTIKELNYPDIISTVGASSSSFLFLFPLTPRALTRFTHPLHWPPLRTSLHVSLSLCAWCFTALCVSKNERIKNFVSRETVG